MSTEHFHVIFHILVSEKSDPLAETQDSKCSNKQDGSCTTIFGLALKVTQCHFCYILLVSNETISIRFKGRGYRSHHLVKSKNL